MKISALFALALGFGSVSAMAADELICQYLTDSVSMTFVVSGSGAETKLKTYRSFFGHTVPSQEESVHQLPASKGSVLAYGNEDQSKVLAINFLDRVDEQTVRGTLTDTATPGSLSVHCRFE